MESEEIDFGGDVHPFAGSEYVKLPEGATVTFAVVGTRPMVTYWKNAGMGKQPSTKDRAEGERNGWAEHNVWPCITWSPLAPSDVGTAAGTVRGKLDVKGRLRYALRAAKLRPATWYTIQRIGSGENTEYRILPCNDVSQSQLMRDVADKAHVECKEFDAKR